MKVLGIDPGTAACGYGIVHESGGRLREVAHGCWRTSARERPEERLMRIFEGVRALIEERGLRASDPAAASTIIVVSRSFSMAVRAAESRSGGLVAIAQQAPDRLQYLVLRVHVFEL